MSHPGQYFFASRNQPNYAWWRPLAEIIVAAVLTVAFVAVIDLSLQAAGVDTTGGGVGSDLPVELVAIVLAALAEEMAFRGLFLQAFTAWTKRPVAGALLAALPFVAMHPQAYGSPVSFAHYFLDALLYALLVWAFNSIWVAVAVHAAWNTFGSIQALGMPTSAAVLVASFAASALATAVVIGVLRRVATPQSHLPASA